MRRVAVLWGVFVSRFGEALAGYRRRHLTADEAGDLLGITGRHFRRLCVRFDEEGVEGLRDRRVGRPSPRRAPAAELARMLGLYREHYREFSVKHFHEAMVRTHAYTLSYTVTKHALQSAGLMALCEHNRGKHRKRRVRRPLPGMLLFQSLPRT